MATRIRLRRMGANKRPFYRVVVADQRNARDGRFIENIGKYHPLEEPSLIEIDEERALHWLRVGAQPSNQVRVLMSRVGIWDRFVTERPSAGATKPSRSEGAAAPRPSKKAQAKAAEASKAAPEPTPAEPEPPPEPQEPPAAKSEPATPDVSQEAPEAPEGATEETTEA